jgi:hypothetical protein
MTRGSIGLPFWANLWYITSKKFKNVFCHPSTYVHFQRGLPDPAG